LCGYRTVGERPGPVKEPAIGLAEEVRPRCVASPDRRERLRCPAAGGWCRNDICMHLVDHISR
jgi:hypothetical protein